MQLSLERWATISWHERLQIHVATLVAITGAPLEIVEDPVFVDILNSLLALGRTHPQAEVGPNGCKLYRRRTRSTMLEESERIQKTEVAKFAQMPCVSLSIDAGTIERRHFLDIILSAPYSELKPFLYTAVERESLTVEDYGNIVIEAIRELNLKNVKVRSIVGDNLPAQVAALAHWSPRSSLQLAEEPFIHGIRYSPCMCHFMQLVVGDFMKDEYGSELDDMLQQMILVSNFAEVRRLMKCQCPRSVKTRWLSRCQAIRWLLSRQVPLTAIDPHNWRKERRKAFQQWFTSENFAKLQVLHRLLYPFDQATKFLEQDTVTLCHVYPVLRDVKEYLRNLNSFFVDSNDQAAAACLFLVDMIRRRRRKLLDRDLLKAAFWLTSFGCISLRDSELTISAPYRIILAYEPPHPIASRGPLDVFSTASGDAQDLDENEDDETECGFDGERIPDEELRDIPRLGKWSRPPVLQFLTEYMTHVLCQSLDEGERDPSTQDRVDQLLQYFFCNPDSQTRCHKTPPDPNKQVELWNRFILEFQDAFETQVVSTIIAIISIPASEASCERGLSRQKRIMGHFRVKSSPELLLARFRFDARDCR
jgi:hypothetical protein